MRVVLIVFLVLGVVLGGYSNVKVDGVVGDKEYSRVFNVDKDFRIHISYDTNNVYIGLVSSGRGWVSVGFGSYVMDKSVMFIGYFDGTNFVVEEHFSVGRNHRKVEKQSIVSFAGKRDEKGTVVEFVIPRKVSNVELVGKVPAIWAYSSSDSVRSYHSKRGSLTIEF